MPATGLARPLIAHQFSPIKNKKDRAGFTPANRRGGFAGFLSLSSRALQA
jgi:hypothetical protein